MPRGQQNSRRRRWTTLVKGAFTVGILAWLLAGIDIGSSVDAIARALGVILLAGFASYALLLVTSTVKWDCLLRGLGIQESKWRLLELYTIGFFASSFLPGAVGGDVLRWQLAGKHTGARLKVAATIVAERMTGLVALLVLCLGAVLFAVPAFATGPVLLLIAAMFAALVLGLALALNRRLTVLAARRMRHTVFRRIVNPIYRLNRTLGNFPKGPLVAALGHSMLFYVSAGFTFYLICVAFGAKIGIVEAIAAQTLVSLLILVPISIGGLGLAQAGDVYLLGLLGIAAPDALAISIIRLLFKYGYVIVGGVLFVRWNARSATGGTGLSLDRPIDRVGRSAV